MADVSGPVLMLPSQKAAYRKALSILIRAHDKLGGVKTVGWAQAWVLRDVYQDLEVAANALLELNPRVVSKHLRSVVKAWST
jgi:hypothetical protein